MKICLWVLALLFACGAGASAAIDSAELAAARALLTKRGQSAAARQAFERIVATDPSCAEAHRALAGLALQRGDADEATAHAEKAVMLDADNADYQHALGDAYGLAAKKAGLLSFRTPGLAKKCLAAFQRASSLAPEIPSYHQSLFDFYLQAPRFLGGGTDKAFAEAATLKKIDPLRGHLAFVTLYTAEKRPDLIQAEFDAALTDAPDNYLVHFQLGRYCAETGQFLDRGLSSLRRCLELVPPRGAPSHAAVHCRIGNILEKKNDSGGARLAYNTALTLDPGFSAASDALKKLK